MRKFALLIFTLFSIAACDLTKLEPAQTAAFMKYFGDDGNTFGVDLLKLDDGYLLLGNNLKDGETALLIKVDKNGNQIWGKNFPGLVASALAKNNDGYFIVGDRINSNNPPTTEMSLTKTNPEGGSPTEVTLGSTNNYHGTGVTVSAAGEIVVCGYINANTDSTFLFGYNSDLTPAWTAVRKTGSAGFSLITSPTLIEKDNTFTTTLLATKNNNNELRPLLAPRDQETTLDSQPLLTNRILDGSLGDFNETANGGGVLVQTVVGDAGNKEIAMALYNNGVEQPNYLIKEPDFDLTAHNVVRASDGDFVVLGATNKHLKGSNTRSDDDFYITKVGFDGTVSATSGFTNIIGGTGKETGAAIVQADDGGFVFLGTMQNTNEVNLMVLVKVNSKGKLIN